MKELNSAISSFKVVAEERSEFRESAKVRELGDIKIMACTTSFAARNSRLLRAMRPNVLLVEEAAELLESHVVTNLRSSICHLIMIGDHKELRPKLHCYHLTKESGNGLDFDHRMRPQISSLIRCTYPDLQDHPSTLNRSDIRGVAHNLVFVNHSALEGGQENDTMLVQTSSNYNDHEADMILKIARYFLQ
eukprot:gene29141-35171_t